MGLYILALLLIWLGVLWWVVKGIMWRVDHPYKALISTIIVVVAYPLPVADEIVGAIQFRNLCEQQVIYKDPNMAKKRGARLKFVRHEKTQISGTAVPVTSELWEFVNESDQSLMIKYVVFETDGGILARNFYLQEGSGPLLFTSACQPKEYPMLASEFEVID
ncbi:hypothetical protein [Massilia genomosp. 1]|uniref:SMODS-associating 2TM beta-strand rich effector domain-containing protein n=1 Tax=Massilia genomosp. 1 TaxID=2609280 RepID=A0ABX0N2P7_9BURK|nr:hypothetical protein [Massilia genomosp. 1]NHZ66898.1 hypothetical protein [Massilia genomosp. 1]